MSDNGARALAHALAIDWTPFWRETPIEDADGTHSVMADFDHEAFAAAVLANGAVFLPDAAELDRLRRIEAAARDLTEKEPRGTLNRYRWNALIAKLRAAEEGSARDGG